MRKLFCAAMLFFFSFGFSQETVIDESVEVVSTTIDEYNYLTKGLPRDISEGRDIKSGYILENYDSKNIGKHSFFISPFLKIIDSKKENTLDNVQLKAISVKIVSQLSKKEYYVCIPINDANLSKEYYKQIGAFPQDVIYLYSLALSESYPVQLNNYLELAKKVKQ